MQLNWFTFEGIPISVKDEAVPSVGAHLLWVRLTAAPSIWVSPSFLLELLSPFPSYFLPSSFPQAANRPKVGFPPGSRGSSDQKDEVHRWKSSSTSSLKRHRRALRIKEGRPSGRGQDKRETKWSSSQQLVTHFFVTPCPISDEVSSLDVLFLLGVSKPLRIRVLVTRDCGNSKRSILGQLRVIHTRWDYGS